MSTSFLTPDAPVIHIVIHFSSQVRCVTGPEFWYNSDGDLFDADDLIVAALQDFRTLDSGV